MGQEVIDAHGHQIDAHRPVYPRFRGDFEFGADPVGRGYEERIGVAGRLQIEQGAESTECGIGAWPPCRPRKGLYPLDKSLSGVDVDARPRIGQTVPSIVHLK